MFVDYAKADQILGRLLDAYRRKEYPYNLPEAIPPQAPKNLPASLVWGSREHALFLFTLCYWMRGGIESTTAAHQLTRLYEADHSIFLPESEPNLVAAELTERFKAVGLGFNSKQIGELWKDNLARISARWNGDPRTIFSSVITYEEACCRVQNKKRRGFRGFQEKMVSMLIYFYMDAGIVDRWNFPIPVDFHALRTLFAHEIMIADWNESGKNGYYTKPILAAARKLFQDYSANNNVDPVVLCEAVWLYSGLMCDKHPGNISIVGEKGKGKKKKKRKGRKTKIVPIPRWVSAAQTRAYKKTCAFCVIQDTCRWCVPSAEYYVGGRIVLRGERDAPPGCTQPLFPIIS
jgi:hypothetical protein